MDFCLCDKDLRKRTKKISLCIGIRYANKRDRALIKGNLQLNKDLEKITKIIA